MPLPFIIGAAAIAAAGFGAKKGYDGYQKKSEADEIIARAKSRYESAKLSFDKQNKATESCLSSLGAFQLSIGEKFSEFNTLAEELLAKLNQARANKPFEINIPKHKLAEIKRLELSTTAYLAKVGGAGVAGAAAAYAVYGGVLALGAASTGTSIATLSGAAAYNAAMAAIGGGSLAAGGFGIAGGAAVLGAAVAAPILAVAGWAYDSHAEDALKDAKKASQESNKAVSKMNDAIKQLSSVAEYAARMRSSLSIINVTFTKHFDALKAMDVILKSGDDSILETMSDKLLKTIENGYGVAAILTDIITTPLFKVKKDNLGNPIMKDNLRQFATDENGMQILNDELPAVLDKASKNVLEFRG